MVKYELLCFMITLIIWLVASAGNVNSIEYNVNNGSKPSKLLDSSQSGSKDEFEIKWLHPHILEKRSDINNAYGPPLLTQSFEKKDCGLCNREPWIPIAYPAGQKTIVNFIPPPLKNYASTNNGYSDSSVLETLRPPATSFNAPSVQYGPPQQWKFQQQNQYYPPRRPGSVPYSNAAEYNIVDYMVPPPINYKIPSSIYGPPRLGNNFQPKPVLPIVPPLRTSVPPNPAYKAPSSLQNYPEQFSSLSIMFPPPIHFDDVMQPDIPQYQNTYHKANVLESVTDNIPAIPSDSYGLPITGDSLNYVSPQEQLSLPDENKEYVDGAIPFPNLSSYPVLPLHNFKNFREPFNGGRLEENTVQIQESVKIADYLASIEHPINVIQSPLIEVSIKDDRHEVIKKPQQNRNNNNEFDSENYNNVQSSAGDSNIYSNNLDTYPSISNSQNFNNINEQLHDSEKSIPNLSEHPIVVEDTHGAASDNNLTFINSNELQSKSNELDILNGSDILKKLLRNHKPLPDISATQSLNNQETRTNNFTMPPLDYSDWTPTYGVTMSRYKVTENSVKKQITTNKPKVLQIIVPYITAKQSGPLKKEWSDKNNNGAVSYNGAYTTLLPVYSPPLTTEVSVWSKYVDSFNTLESTNVAEAPKSTTGVYNIKELLNRRTESLSKNFTYDIVSLQKHIDDWTQLAYSQTRQKEIVSTPKGIPQEYFTTQRPKDIIGTTIYHDLVDQNTEQYNNIDNIDANLVVPTPSLPGQPSTTTNSPVVSVTTEKKSLWNQSHVTISPHTKEKVYIVTPQSYSFYTSTPATAWSAAPKVENGKINNASTYNSYRFSVRVEPQNNNATKEKSKMDEKSAIKVVYSEWPHLINNLQTTTTKQLTRHPLFGLMGMPASRPDLNSTTESDFFSSSKSSI